MSSMYETIRELPLFKGIGDDQLSQMLEKTSMEFLKFEEGDIIAKEKDSVKAIDFILGGRVRLIYKLKNYSISIEEIIEKGSMIGAGNLYGMETHYTATAQAMGKVSLMRLAKSQYMNILLSDRIYILNFVNYLSASAQRGKKLILNQKPHSIRQCLNTLISSIVSKNAETVMITGEDRDIAEYCGVSIPDFSEWKTNELAHNKIMINQRGIIMKSPHLQR